MSTRERKKLESLGIIAGSIAHDLNNILTGILGHVSYLRISSQESSNESLQAIEDGAKRAASMTQRILEYARGQEGSLELVNFSKIIQTELNVIKTSLTDSIDLIVNIEDEQLCVMGDEDRLSQLVINLVVNARDALPEGGSIKIEVKTESVEEDDLNISSGKYVCLRVVDNGLGIDEEVKPRIFEPFFTTKSDKGTGLGLATVYSITCEHQGIITLESEKGKGTAFNVYLPHCDDLAEEEEESNSEDLPRGSERILVVDDEETVRTILEKSLEFLGYQVDVAENGLRGLELFEENANAYDLVILDMIMPEMSGDEVFMELKKINKNVAVLLASGYASDERTAAVMEAGGRGFIQKPFAIEDLAEEVRRCLDVK